MVLIVDNLSYVGCLRVLSSSSRFKLWVHEPDTFFLEAAREISEKWNFFVKRSVPENFQWEIFLGQVPTMLCSGVADNFSLHHPPHLTTTQLAQASLKEGFKGWMFGNVQ